MSKKNANLKSGKFKEKEMKLYGVKEKYIQSVLEYQEKLPILQDDDIQYVNGRDLYSYAGYEDDKFTQWIKRKLERVMADEDEGFFTKMGETSKVGGRPTIEYHLTLDTAKDIMMTEKGNLGKITRDYFKAMETMMKSRQSWNDDRYQTIEMFHELTDPLSHHKDKLSPYLPKWSSGNPFKFEMNMLNQIIIGMSAKEYRVRKGLKKKEPIRNTFTEYELFLVHKLEEYDAILIDVQNIYNPMEREELLTKYFKMRLSDQKSKVS